MAIRLRLCLVLCALVVTVAGCGPKQEKTGSAPAEKKVQVGQNVIAASGEAKNEKANTTRPATILNPLTKYGNVERTINDVKAYNYYVDDMPKFYLWALGEAVEKPDGFRWLSACLDAKHPIYETQKKYIEDCIAKGTKLRLLNYDLAEYTNKGHILEKDTDHHLYELKVHVKYTMEYTYADNRREIKELRKVFTMRQMQMFGKKDKGEDFVQRITVVITDIADDSAKLKDGGGK
jgi:hypothetical protein